MRHAVPPELWKRAPFTGPFVDGRGWPDGADGQIRYWSYSGFYAGLALAQTSPDPAERQYGLDLAITVGEMWLRNVSLGYLCALWKAKAEALAGAMLTAQFPATGQIPRSPDVNATHRAWGGPGYGDGGNRGEYSTMALLDLAELWEPVKP